MRDPWIPIALLLITLLTIWLGIVGPMPEGFAAWLQHWQTLAAAFVASCAAYIAFRNTSRTLSHAEKLERNRRDKKHAALRAVLPLALAQINAYSEQSAKSLCKLAEGCIGEALPFASAPQDLAKPLPTETLKTLADFIEYSDALDVGVIESMVATIQIHDSRIRGMVADNHESPDHLILKIEIEGRVIDAACIYAGADSAFDYARRRESFLPDSVSWEAVRSALRNMRLWDEQYPELYQAIARRELHSAGPFNSPSINSIDILN